ncbi:MAG: thioesterase family protein [Mycobacteriaceae bacterium]
MDGAGVGVLVQVGIRWSDMDAYGHLNHARTVTILEEARVQWLFEPGSPTADMARGSVVADLHVHYRSQLTHADTPLSVLMWISRMRAADAVIAYELRPAARPESAPAVTASTQLVPFDLAAQRPRRFTDVERCALQGWVRG